MRQLRKSLLPSAKPIAGTKPPKGTVFDDGATSIVDRDDSIRIVRCGVVTIYHHANVEVEILVYADGDVWLFGPTSKVEHLSLPTRNEAETEALRLAKSMKKRLK